jgi:hypothetical protein
MKFAVFENVTLLPLPGKKQYMYLWRVTWVRMSFLRGLFTSCGKTIVCVAIGVYLCIVLVGE